MKIKLGERRIWLLPQFYLPRPAPHSPHVSTAAWPNIYAIAIAAMRQVVSTAPVAAAGLVVHIDFTPAALSFVTAFFDVYH